MQIRIEIESDELIDGLWIRIDDNQQVIVYKSFRDADEGLEIDTNLKVEFFCPSCESWTDSENWTEKYICQGCAWDGLETEAYGESLNDNG